MTRVVTWRRSTAGSDTTHDGSGEAADGPHRRLVSGTVTGAQNLATFRAIWIVIPRCGLTEVKCCTTVLNMATGTALDTSASLAE